MKIPSIFDKTKGWIYPKKGWDSRGKKKGKEEFGGGTITYSLKEKDFLSRWETGKGVSDEV